MHRTSTVLLATFTLLSCFIGCDRLKEKLAGLGGDADAAADAASATQVATNRTTSIDDACSLLPDTAVTSVFAEVSGKNFQVDEPLEQVKAVSKGVAPTKAEQGDYRVAKVQVGSGRICSYSWPKADAAAISARNRAKSQQVVREAMKGGKGGLAGGLLSGLSMMENERTSVSLSFASSTPSASAEIAKASYDARIKQVREGMSGKAMAEAAHVDDPAVAKQLAEMGLKPDTTLVDVPGVGDAATWSAKNQALHVLSGAFAFSVAVDTDSAKDKDHAIALAKSVVGAL